jgi:hypothetical protein
MVYDMWTKATGFPVNLLTFYEVPHERYEVPPKRYEALHKPVPWTVQGANS